MSVLEKLKTESMRLRKERSPLAASIVFALSEIEKIGKNSGNRQTTEDEAIRVIQKLVATIDENLKLDVDDGRRIALEHEKQILLSVLPQMATEEDVTIFLQDLMHKISSPLKKGDVMKALRDHYGSRVDMKRAGQLVTELCGI